MNAKIQKDGNGGYYIEYTKRTKPLSSLGLVDNAYSNDNAKKDLAVFGLSDDFDYSKPVDLIKRLIKNHYNKNAIVLDFFAGSGTTAQAVLELNVEDGGKRQFIICTNNQNSICEQVTYTRCKDVIMSYEYDKSARTMLMEYKIKISDFGKNDISAAIKSIKEEHDDEYDKFTTEIDGGYVYVYGVTVFDKLHGIPANLKYYKTDFVSKNNDSVSEKLLSHIKEMIQLEHGIDIDNKEYLIVLSEDEADSLESNWANYPNLKGLYVSHDVLFTKKQNTLFSEVPIYIIPDDYFKFELQEVGEAW